MPIIADLSDAFRGRERICDDDFTRGVSAAALHLSTSLRMPRFSEILDEPRKLRLELTARLEPPFVRGICGTEFQILAERAVEEMFYNMPDERRIGTNYRRSDTEFIPSDDGVHLRGAEQYLRAKDEKRAEAAQGKKPAVKAAPVKAPVVKATAAKIDKPYGKAPRKALGMKKKTVSVKKAKYITQQAPRRGP